MKRKALHLEIAEGGRHCVHRKNSRSGIRFHLVFPNHRQNRLQSKTDLEISLSDIMFLFVRNFINTAQYLIICIYSPSVFLNCVFHFFLSWRSLVPELMDLLYSVFQTQICKWHVTLTKSIEELSLSPLGARSVSLKDRKRRHLITIQIP